MHGYIMKFEMVLKLYAVWLQPQITLPKSVKKDGLHLNEKGYALWNKVLRETLKLPAH
jgi:lysophospholipase L1-like esterase